jgi:DNA-binding transcriptional ArsR family regulator
MKSTIIAMPAKTSEREKIPHPPTSALDLATILRVAGDPVRLEIVRLLADGKPRICGEIQTTVGIPPSTGSYHLRLLREAGVIRARQRGIERELTLRTDDLEERFPGIVAVLTS